MHTCSVGGFHTACRDSLGFAPSLACALSSGRGTMQIAGCDASFTTATFSPERLEAEIGLTVRLLHAA